MSAHKVFCEYMCGIPLDRMPPHFLKVSKVCQAKRFFVSICAGLLQIECHHIWKVSKIGQATRPFVSIYAGFLQPTFGKYVCIYIFKYLNTCQPTSSLVSIYIWDSCR